MNDQEDPSLWPADSPAATAHIALLQGIITRLANNSASSKTWCLTLVAALLSLAGAVHAPPMIHATLVPILVFGFVDVMYLATEVAYRNLYNQVVQTMRDGTYGRHSVYDARASLDAGCIISAIASWSIIPYYALLAFYVIAIASGWSALLAAPPKLAG